MAGFWLQKDYFRSSFMKWIGKYREDRSGDRNSVLVCALYHTQESHLYVKYSHFNTEEKNFGEVK